MCGRGKGRQAKAKPREAYAPAHDPSGDELAEDEGGEARDEGEEAVGQRVDGPRPEHAAARGVDWIGRFD